MNLARLVRSQPAAVTARSAEIEGQVIQVRAPGRGAVEEVHVKENQLVRQGDVLVEVRPARPRRALPAPLEASFIGLLKDPAIRAPVAGRVVQVDVGTHDAVEGSQPLAAILDSDDVWIVAEFNAEDVESVRPGQRASVFAAGVSFTARIEWVDQADGAALLEFAEEELNPAEVLLPGTPVQVTVDVHQPRLHLR